MSSLFSLLMSVRMQVSVFKERRRRRRGWKAKQQESRKRPKEHAFVMKCLLSVYSKFCRHAVERWCRAQAHKSSGVSLIDQRHRAGADTETQVSRTRKHQHIVRTTYCDLLVMIWVSFHHNYGMNLMNYRINGISRLYYIYIYIIYRLSRRYLLFVLGHVLTF